MRNNLENLLKEKKEEFEKGSEAYEQRKDEWLHRIEELFGLIERWLEPLKKKGYLQTSRQYLDVSEEVYGKYHAESLVIAFFNGRTITIRPVGLGVIGANGRLDIDLEDRLVMILGVPGSRDWEFAERVGRGHDTYPFNRETFEKLISDYVKGF